MQKDPFYLLIDLVNFDQELFRDKEKIKKIEKSVSDLNNELTQLNNSLEISKNTWINVKKIVDEKELKMRELDLEEKEKKQRLEHYVNHKEYLSAKKELEKIKQTQHSLEEELVTCWNNLENTEKEYNLKKNISNKKAQEIDALIKNKLEEIDSIKTKINELNFQRPEKEKNIPEEWIAKYNIMHNQVPNPIVPVINESCSACFHYVTKQDIINLKHKKLIQCKGCYRFLYIEQ